MAGIDQIVNQTADAYRGNPQGLQQKYAASQQLIDLLALQRLKSEKDAAARDMQAKMQQNPATIKQQREQELLQRTKQEMVGRVAPTLQRKQAQAQAAMQQAPQAGAQAQQGLAALQQQQAPVQRASQGGIMRAYSGGGAVKRYAGEGESQLVAADSERLEYERNLRRQSGLSEEAIEELLDEYDRRNEITGGISEFFTEDIPGFFEGISDEGGLMPGNPYNALADMGQEEEVGVAEPAMEQADPLVDAGIEVDAVVSEPTNLPPPTQTGPTTQQQPPEQNQQQGGIANVGSGGGGFSMQNVNATPQTAIDDYTEGLNEVTDEMAGLELERPDSMQIRGDVTDYVEKEFGELRSEEELRAQKDKDFEDTLERFKMDERLSEYDKTLKTMRETFERQNDPKRQRMKRISAFLRGFAGTTNIGTGFARASASRAAEMERADQAERNAQKQLYEVMTARDATEGEILNAAETSATESYKSAMAKQNTLADTISRMSNQEIQAQSNFLNTQYKGKMDVLGTKADSLGNVLRAQMQQFQSVLRASTAERSMMPQSLMALARLMDSFSTAESEALSTVLGGLQEVAMVAANPEASEEERKQAKATIAVAFEKFNEQSGLAYYAPLIQQLAREIGVELPDIGNKSNEQPQQDVDFGLSDNASQYLD